MLFLKLKSINKQYYLIKRKYQTLWLNIPALYSGGPGFKSRPGDRLSWGFHGFTHYLQENAGTVP
jgi:hypothetical protein